MFSGLSRLFGYGQDNEKETQKPKPSQNHSSNNSYWIPDGNGNYVKVGGLMASAPVSKSTTATAIKSLTNNTPSDISPSEKTGSKSILSIDANPGGFSFQLNKLSDDDSLPSNQNLDALGNFQVELTKTAASLQSFLEKWKALKQEVIGGDSGLLQYASVKKEGAGSTVSQGMAIFFTNFFGKIRKFLEPADAELHELLTETHEQVQELCVRLELASVKLKDTSNSEEDARKICIDMCDISMEINNHLITMIDNIQAELSTCLKFEKIGEQAAKQLILFLVLMATKIPVTDLNCDFSESYRNFLFNEIEKEKIELEHFETDVIGELLKIMNEIKKQQVVWVEARTKAEEQKKLESEVKETQSGVDKLSLFATNQEKPVDGAPDKTSEPIASIALNM